MKTNDLRRKIKKDIDRVPEERLVSLADYVVFLSRPPLKTRIAVAEKALCAGLGVNWRKVRNDC